MANGRWITKMKRDLAVIPFPAAFFPPRSEISEYANSEENILLIRLVLVETGPEILRTPYGRAQNNRMSCSKSRRRSFWRGEESLGM
jgi:hypothetical protein